MNEVPLGTVATKYNCSRGQLQSLQQSASTYAGAYFWMLECKAFLGFAAERVTL